MKFYKVIGKFVICLVTVVIVQTVMIQLCKLLTQDSFTLGLVAGSFGACTAFLFYSIKIS